jgi:hypothetical protein
MIESYEGLGWIPHLGSGVLYISSIADGLWAEIVGGWHIVMRYSQAFVQCGEIGTFQDM